ncbi:MAG TPA: TonB-dependent receptor [Steroidobacteraceae bacterium]|nr:TonB-dependent receptor [Steroidobacteraceae bacterium]
MRNKRYGSRVCIGLLGAAWGTAFLAPPAQAAEPPRADVLDEIIVTAQKREERLQDVPVSISVISGESVERLGFRNILDMAIHVPSLHFRTDHSQRAFISFRGIGGVGGSGPGVSIFVDGVSQPTAVFFSAPLLDVERIEFLKGPQGTLYGRNTLSGAINVISRAPGNELTGSVEATAGNADTYGMRASLNAPLVDDRLFLRLAAAHEETDGFIENLLTRHSAAFRDVSTARASLRYLPSDALRLDFSGYYSEQRNAGNPYSIVPVDAIDAVPRTVTLNPQSVTDFYIFGGSLRAAWELAPDRRIVSISSYDRQLTNAATFDVDYTPAPVFRFDPLPFSRTVAQELRYEAPLGSSGQWMLGAYYTKVHSDSRQELLLNNTFLAQKSVNPTELENRAAFANVSFRPTPKLEVSAGARYDSTERTSTTIRLDLPPSATNPLVVPGKESLWQPKVSASYFFTPDVMAYATVARGYRLGGFNGALAPPALRSYDPETTWNYELGAKTMLADGRLSLNVAAFLIENADTQVNDIITGTTGAPTNVIRNGGEVRARGFELELAARPIPALQLNAAASLNDVVVQANPDPTLVGTRQALVDRWHFSLAGQYEWALGAQSALFIAGDYAGFGPTGFGANVRQEYKSLVGAQVGMRWGAFGAEVYGKNLLDEDYVHIYSQVALLVPNSALSFAGDARSYGLRLRYDF